MIAASTREEETIALPDGGTFTLSEAGQYNDSPMMTVSGAGYVGLIEPPEGVFETVFFGERRLVVSIDEADDTPVKLQVCPGATVTVPVLIEAGI